MSKKLWGGRFVKETNPKVEKFSASIDVDKELAFWDVLGSLLHVTVLMEAKFITQDEYNLLSKGLDEIFDDIKTGNFLVDNNAEDIHSDIQNKLEQKVGDVVLKLHTARSRNDQIVFDLKLYSRGICKYISEHIAEVERTIEDFTKRYKGINIPGYTHMQHAQPISLADYFLAYRDMFSRDAERIKDVGRKIKISLGSGALAGTAIGAEKYNVAVKKLCEERKYGFVEWMDLAAVKNSIDNVSDRDFVIELLSALAILGMHLSRLSEDLIIWSSKEFGFVDIDEAFCTGSSLMPQKKNPDVLELIRGNTGLLYGNLMNVLVMMKGLPLSYNRDMQLDKAPLFSSVKVISDELDILKELIASMRINKENIDRQLADESLYATDIAHSLVEKGVPFKEAHRLIGELVRFSLNSGKLIKEMSEAELQKISPCLTRGAIEMLMNPRYSVESKKSIQRD